MAQIVAVPRRVRDDEDDDCGYFGESPSCTSDLNLFTFTGNHMPPGKASSMELAAPGRRERSKLDKRRRISEAARAAFTEFGYERANMREIAKRAGVATGTLFLYAPDKRNLLLWILNDDLDDITETSFAALMTHHPDAGLLEQLLFVFEARYRYWGADPDLSLHALQELIIARDVQPTPVSHLAPYLQRRLVLQEHIVELVRAQQRRGRIRIGEDPAGIARLILAVYNSAVRDWLRTSDANAPRGISELRELLQLALTGCLAISVRNAGETLN
jgi:AcrR family transcriptional regulator